MFLPLDRLRAWWFGDFLTDDGRQVIGLTIHDDGSMTFRVPDPDYSPPYVRFKRAMRSRMVRCGLSGIGAIIAGVVVVAISKALGLS